MLMDVRPGVFSRRDPEGDAPVLFEIPRSGAEYPRDFRSIAALTDLQRSISMYVEEVYAGVVEKGATWLYAHFPNVYIDPNRHELDIDPAQLDGDWPEELQPGPKTKAGMGLIPTICAGTKPLYDAPLPVAEVQKRLSTYYWPYHDEVKRLLAAFHAQHGVAYHLSCHSMPALGANGERRSDFDLGDRNGTTCSPELVELIGSTLKGFGYKVTSNAHFIGAESVRKHGNPTGGIHSLQIEMNRGLYMDEAARTRLPRLAEVREHLAAVAEKVVEFSKAR
ncbi:N-formylglutamate amidohydrolase [Acetobacteraceae bacterium H6797]|nr:N-formylglutamate amidohydrolase [Acetobacteraceae bacterium H6797]